MLDNRPGCHYTGSMSKPITQTFNEVPYDQGDDQFLATVKVTAHEEGFSVEILTLVDANDVVLTTEEVYALTLLTREQYRDIVSRAEDRMSEFLREKWEYDNRPWDGGL